MVSGISKARSEAPGKAIGLRPIVFREIFPPSAAAWLSFYGGVPVGPANLTWPRIRNKPGDAPLSFIMQWHCGELTGQDASGLLPQDGVLYLFCDLTWGDPFDFQFILAPGPVDGMQAMSIPPDLPPVYGKEGTYQVPYCSPQIAKVHQDVPRLLPKWPFDKLHREEVDAIRFLYRVNGDDIGVIELRQDLGLTAKTPEPFGILRHLAREHLECYVAAEFCIGGAINLTHAASAKR